MQQMQQAIWLLQPHPTLQLPVTTLGAVNHDPLRSTEPTKNNFAVESSFIIIY